MQTLCTKIWLKISTTNMTQHPLLPFSLFRVSFACDFHSNSGQNMTSDHPILGFLEGLYKHPIDLRTLHAYSITSGLITDTFAASRIVEFCFKSVRADSRYARVIFDSIDRPDVYTWNAMIIGHAEHESPESGINYYFRMLEKLVPPNNYTFALVVKACTLNTRDIGVGKKMHGQIMKRGMEDLLVVRNSLMNMYCNMGCLVEARLLFDKSLFLDLISWNSMISAYGKYGDVKAARELFLKMPERSLISWSAMIDGYVRSGCFAEALGCFNEIQALGVKPDIITLVSVLKACANLGALDQGRWVHLYIDRNMLRRERNVILGTALVDMYAKCGCIDVALDLFNGMHDKDVILWNAMIGGLAMHGHGRTALQIFSTMRRHHAIPNETTFVTVLCACAHSGMVREGVKIFESMKEEYGIEPKVEHYGCLADLFGRAGLVCEAEELLCSMPMEPQASQWGALMAACRTHNNIEVGERVGKRLISMEPLDGGRYVLLSNLYAAAGRWEDARETRRAMEEKGAKKETGCSVIELDGSVHEFIVGNTTHPQSREIYAMLGWLERKLKMNKFVKYSSQGIDLTWDND